SLTSNDTVVRPRSTRTVPTTISGGVLSISNATLSISPASAVATEFDGRSDATTFTKYVPFGTVVVSQTRIDSVIALRSVLQLAAASRGQSRAYIGSSSF